MSKRLALGSLAALSLLASAATYAATPGFYLGAGVGQSNLDVDGIPFNESDTAFKVFGGYSFNDYFALELTYFDAGKPSKQITSTANVEVSLDGFNLSAVGRIPVGEQFALFGKLGYAFYDSTISSNVVSFRQSDSNEDLSYGIGAAFSFTDKFEMRAEYEGVDVQDASFTVWSISGVFKF